MRWRGLFAITTISGCAQVIGLSSITIVPDEETPVVVDASSDAKEDVVVMVVVDASMTLFDAAPADAESDASDASDAGSRVGVQCSTTVDCPNTAEPCCLTATNGADTTFSYSCSDQTTCKAHTTDSFWFQCDDKGDCPSPQVCCLTTNGPYVTSSTCMGTCSVSGSSTRSCTTDFDCPTGSACREAGVLPGNLPLLTICH